MPVQEKDTPNIESAGFKYLDVKSRILKIIFENIKQNNSVDEIKQSILKETCNFFNANRAIIQEYYSYKIEDLNKNSEYLANTEEKSMFGLNHSREGIKYWEELIFDKKQEIIISDIEKYVMENGLQNTDIEILTKEFNFKAYICIPLILDNKVFGVFALFFPNKIECLSDLDIEFARIIAHQAGLAIFNHKLQQDLLQTANRERLLRNSINLIRNSLDINEIKEHIINEIGKAFEADRCFIRIFDKKNDTLLPVDKHSEYLSSPDIKSLIGVEPNREIHIYLKNKILEDNANIIPDCEKFAAENPNNPFIKLLKKYPSKSSYGIPIFYSGKFMGVLVVQYVYKKVMLNESQLEFLKTIVDQTGTAIHQSQLYNLISQKAQRENLLRSISEKIRNSLDINEIKRTVVTETAKVFKADRCIIREFNNSKSRFQDIDEYSEYLSSPEEKSLVGVDPSSIGFHLIQKEYLENNILIAEDFISYLKVKNLERTKCIKFSTEYGLKSTLGINIFYSNHLFGNLVVHYTKNTVKIDEDKISLLKIIADQAGLAIYRAKLFKAIKQNNKREKLLRKITNEVKNNNNVNNFLASVFNLIAKEFKANRIIILEPEEIFNDSVIINEYKTTKNLPSLRNIDKANIFEGYFNQILIGNKTNLIINNIENSDCPDDIKKLCSLSGINSILGAPFKINNEKWGGIILTDNNSRKWAGFDINLIRQATENIYSSRSQSNLSDKSHLISNIAHEIRTPLSLINGYSEAISNELANKTEEFNLYIDGIRNNSNRINEIISNFIQISQIEEEHRSNKIQFYEHLLEEIIDFSIQNCKETAQVHNIKIAVDCDANIIVKVNVLLLEQAISSLILQAIKYCEPSGSLLVRAYQNSDETVIYFNFARNQKIINLNLDLSLVQIIAGVHKGFIQINNGLHEGNIFSIHLSGN